MSLITVPILLGIASLAPVAVAAQETPTGNFDAALAQSLGADERGMRSYVLVILKTGPAEAPEGEQRNQMFRGHFGNMQRLADAGHRVLAGPLDGEDGRRGLYVFAVPDIKTAKSHVATDPVIVNGEMVAEYHAFYGSAGLMMMDEISRKISKKSP